ncbi:hypothetical protein EBT25_00005, partial [bacterium]|nr:hypothetical protein [bacterium]
MGASAPKSETVVKGGKPTVVREWLSPDYLEKLTGLAEHYGQRAQQAAATRQSNVNRYLSNYGVSPVYDPYKTASGETIQPYQAPNIYDASGLVEAAKTSGMFKPPISNKKKEPREAYSDAIKNVQTNELYGYN